MTPFKGLDLTTKKYFFDDAATLEDLSFWKQHSNFPKKFSEIKHIEGILFKKSKKTNFWKSRYYVLFDDRLAYFKVASFVQAQ